MSLRGHKENVIMGRLTPAGTGTSNYRFLSVVFEEGEKEDRALMAEEYRKEMAGSA